MIHRSDAHLADLPVPADVSGRTPRAPRPNAPTSPFSRGGPAVEMPDPPRRVDATAAGAATPAGDGTAARALILELGRALHAAGSPSDRTESLLDEAAARCGLEAVFFVTPTSIMASFADGTRVMRGEPGDVHLGRMTDLEAVVAGLRADPDAIAAGRDRLAETISAAPRYGRWTTRLSFAGAGAAAGVLLGASAPGALFAAAGSFTVGLGLEAAATRPRLARAALVIASAAISVGASLFAAVTGSDAMVISLASLIVLLPGLSLTLAMRELAARHLVSGSARLMGAAVDFVAIGFGLALGERVAAALLSAAGTTTLAPRSLGSLGPEWDWAALLVAPLTFMVLFRAPPRALVPIITICLAAWGTASWIGREDPRLAPMIAAAVAGLMANATSRRLRMPAAVFLVPGIMLLVPGVLGMRSLDAMMDADALGGITTAVSTVLVGTAIAAGLLVANAALPPRGSG